MGEIAVSAVGGDAIEALGPINSLSLASDDCADASDDCANGVGAAFKDRASGAFKPTDEVMAPF